MYPPIERQVFPGKALGKIYGEHQAVLSEWSRVGTRSTYGDDWEYYGYTDYKLLCTCSEDLGFVGKNPLKWRLPFIEHVVETLYSER